MKNFLSVDVEDYYQVTGLSDIAPISKWDHFASRIEGNLDLILELLGDIKATFFVLGWEAEHRPQLIKKIASKGHEIAIHGRKHINITAMTKEEFAIDINSTIKLLEDLSGNKIIGHRAPSFSITKDTPWVFEVLAQLGVKYDSSVFPVKRLRGGIEGVERKPFKIDTRCGELWEFPLSIVEVFKKKIPVAGGGFFRIYPYWFTKWAINSLNNSNIPAVVYIHPWEFDPEQPKLKSSFSQNGFKHYVNLRSTRQKFKKLLNDYNFITFKDYLKQKQN
jgi:polysaccharide deacetylase family protein (PEP-CTERM system associated)